MVFETVVQALFYFLPGYFANSFPVFLARFHLLEFLNVPIDFGYVYKGERLFGETKTWRGVVGGTFIAMFIGIIQFYLLLNFNGLRWLEFSNLNLLGYIFVSFLMGLGVGLGDLIKSFFKRRLHIKSTRPFVPFDQMDFLGGLLLSFFVFIPELPHLFVLFIFSPFLPIMANLAAYKLGWKKVWW